LITVEGRKIELLPYPLWATWTEKTVACSGVEVDTSNFVGQVVGLAEEGQYCVQGSTGMLTVIEASHFDEGDLETFATRGEAWQLYQERERADDVLRHRISKEDVLLQELQAEMES